MLCFAVKANRLFALFFFFLGIVLYKSIMLCNNERTPQVVRNAMMKLGLEGDPDSYTLSQMLPDRGATVYLNKKLLEN